MMRRDARARGRHGALLTSLALSTLLGCSEQVVVARELAQNVSRLDAAPAPADAAPAPPSEPLIDAGRRRGAPTDVSEPDAGEPDASLPDEDPADDDGNPFDID
jgi:hypothetical protein